jgi:O-antigen ligase
LSGNGDFLLKEAPDSRTTSLAADISIADALQVFARWALLGAIVLTMTTPRFRLGGFNLTAGDLLGVLAGVAWLASWLLTPARPVNLMAAFWPSIIVIAGAGSAITSLDVRAVGVGLLALVALWVLPAMVVPNLISTPARVGQLLMCISVGSLIAASGNLARAVEMGAIDGSLPQVWGPAQYFQGYFQVIGMTVAVSQVFAAIGSRRVGTALAWCLAGLVNASALLLTQTRGAWLAAVVAMIVLGVVWRPSVLVATAGLWLMAGLGFWGTDWSSGIRERVQSIFSLEAGISGFESSLGRLALLVTTWRMFLDHPWLGVGLKNFPLALPQYAPAGTPFAYEMGPDRILTDVQGPHSTYLSLLAEVGGVGLVAVVCWQAGALRRLYRESRSRASLESAAQRQTVVLFTSVIVITAYNFFFEMNQTGMLVFVALVALGYRVQSRGTPSRRTS